MSPHGQLLQRLLPPVSFDPNGARIQIELAAEGLVLDSVAQRIDDLLEENDPRTAAELFPDWERVFGLPDSCIGGDQTSAERRAALLLLDSMVGGQSPAWYIDLAAKLGYSITITELHPETTEDDTEYPLYDDAANFVWQVNAPLVSVLEATTEDDTEMPLAIWGNQRLECVINRYKPAHTLVIFSYS